MIADPSHRPCAALGRQAGPALRLRDAMKRGPIATIAQFSEPSQMSVPTATRAFGKPAAPRAGPGDRRRDTRLPMRVKATDHLSSPRMRGSPSPVQAETARAFERRNIGQRA